MNETTFLAAADYLNATLLPFGFDLIVLDGGWAGGYDSYGRPVPDAAKFPSTAGGAGLRALSDMAHARGLRFGVWDVRGVPVLAVEGKWPIYGSAFTADQAARFDQNCSWEHSKVGVLPNAAGEAWYASAAAYYAQQGVNYVKMDCMDLGAAPGGGLYMDDFETFAVAFKALEIEVSVSPGSLNPANATWIGENGFAKHYRITGDFWDIWDNGE